MKNLHYYTTVPAASRNPKSPNGINQFKNPLKYYQFWSVLFLERFNSSNDSFLKWIQSKVKACSSLTVKHIMLFFMEVIKYGQFTVHEELNQSVLIVAPTYGEEVCIC